MSAPRLTGRSWNLKTNPFSYYAIFHFLRNFLLLLRFLRCPLLLSPFHLLPLVSIVVIVRGKGTTYGGIVADPSSKPDPCTRFLLWVREPRLRWAGLKTAAKIGPLHVVVICFLVLFRCYCYHARWPTCGKMAPCTSMKPDPRTTFSSFVTGRPISDEMALRPLSEPAPFK